MPRGPSVTSSKCVCVVCGRAFLAGRSDAKVCSPACARKRYHGDRKRATVKAVCERCGAEFLHRPDHPRHYCTEACRLAAASERGEGSTAHANVIDNMRVKGGDGSGRWRRRRRASGVRLSDSEVMAGSSEPYLTPETTRIEWRR